MPLEGHLNKNSLLSSFCFSAPKKSLARDTWIQSNAFEPMLLLWVAMMEPPPGEGGCGLSAEVLSTAGMDRQLCSGSGGRCQR